MIYNDPINTCIYEIYRALFRFHICLPVTSFSILTPKKKHGISLRKCLACASFPCQQNGKLQKKGGDQWRPATLIGQHNFCLDCQWHVAEMPFMLLICSSWSCYQWHIVCCQSLFTTGDDMMLQYLTRASCCFSQLLLSSKNYSSPQVNLIDNKSWSCLSHQVGVLFVSVSFHFFTEP